MERLCYAELCTGCGACAGVCPVGCIRMVADAEGFLRPEVDGQTCIGCNRCQRVCPVINQPVTPEGETTAYAAINTDDQIRYNSTSGGVFTLLGQWVLARGGIVFGAAYDEALRVVHCAAEHPDDLRRFRGAKYAQSQLMDVYHRVRSCLMGGRYVLFSGTPCQIGGLVSFLGEHPDKLILVDLICHGVPSPAVWQHYVRYRGEQDAAGARPIAINLRSKETGWPSYSIRFDYPNGAVYSATQAQDPYLRGFVGDLYLRPSCYHCKFKGSTRLSDFTLGDYWGVWNQLPEYHDEKGTSLVLLHTEKAKSIWEALASKCRYQQVDVSAALAGNPSALLSSLENTNRRHFFGRYRQEDFAALVQELCPPPPPPKQSRIRRVVRKIRHIFKKITTL